jgi:hypothetical protein
LALGLHTHTDHDDTEGDIPMHDIRVCTPDDLRGTSLEELADGRQIVSLIGSGASSWAPTDLPTGMSLSNATFQALFTDAGTLPHPDLRREFDRLPFELVMQQCPAQPRLRALFQDLFSDAVPNPVHERLAHAAADGKIADFVTTNYDCAFDAALASRYSATVGDRIGPFQRVVSSIPDHRPLKCYFKIHGSVDDGSGESLVFALEHEGSLPIAKERLLSGLLENRTLLVIGYSGRDFEICPSLLKMGIHHIVWITFRQEDLGIGARNVLRRHSHVVLEGDLQDWLSILFPPAPVLRPARYVSIENRFRRSFSVRELELWRLGILNRLSFASVAVNTALSLKAVPGESVSLAVLREALTADALHQHGRYRRAALHYEEAARLAKASALDAATVCRAVLGASDNWRVYGKLIRGLHHVRTAEEIAASFPNLQPIIKTKRLLFLRHEYQIARICRNTWWTRRVQARAARIIEEISQQLLAAAEYFDYQQVVLWTQRFGIAEIVDPRNHRYPVSTSAEGFEELAYTMARSMAFREDAAPHIRSGR